MGAINRASLILFLGGLAQVLAYADLFPKAPFGILFIVSYLPWFILFTISFCKQPPPISFRGFRWCMIFAMVWYALASITNEVLRFFIHVPPRGVDPVTAEGVILVARVVGFLAMLSFIVFIRACITLRQLELKTEFLKPTTPDSENG